MGRPSKLTHEQWAIAKARWEGCDIPGFAWLSREIETAWGVQVARRSLDQEARLKGWEKGGEPSQSIAAIKAINDHGGELYSAKNGATKEAGGVVLSLVQKGESKPKSGRKAKGGAADEKSPEEPRDALPTAKPPRFGVERLRGSVGRPTKYSPDFVEAILDFFDKEPGEWHDVEQFNGSVKRQLLPTNPPMLADFAKSIGVSVDTLGRWANAVEDDGSIKNPDFAEAYARAREMRESFILRGGMLEMLEPRVVQFALKNEHGWQDQPARKVALASVSKDELDRRFGDRMLASRKRMQEILEERADLLGPSGQAVED